MGYSDCVIEEKPAYRIAKRGRLTASRSEAGQLEVIPKLIDWPETFPISFWALSSESGGIATISSLALS